MKIETEMILEKIKSDIEDLKHHYPMGNDWELAINECLKIINLKSQKEIENLELQAWKDFYYRHKKELSYMDSEIDIYQKAVPMFAIIRGKDSESAICPRCGQVFYENDKAWKSKFCYSCGQVLDWGGIEYERQNNFISYDQGKKRRNS